MSDHSPPPPPIEEGLPSPPSSEQLSDQQRLRQRRLALVKIGLALLLVAVGAFIYWFLFIRFHESTKDSYVNGNAVTVMSPISGNVVTIYADNTDYVKQGQLLIKLDPTNYQLAFDKAQVDLALAARQVKQLKEDVKQREADLLLREADLVRARQDYERRYGLRHTQAISQEDLNHAFADLEVAQAAVNVAQHQLEAAIVSLGNTPLEHHPTIENAKIILRTAYVNLVRCSILSPATGFVAQRQIQVGESITPQRALMSIIPLNQIWVDANFKETQLSDIRIDQPTTLTSDIYGSGVVYHGRVQGIVAGTGTIFSLLPAQNATGNWIKIVQRVPVRILLDPEEIKEHPLFLGLSMETTVNTSDTSSPRLAPFPLYAPLLATNVLEVNMEPIEELIQNIVITNLMITPSPKEGAPP